MTRRLQLIVTLTAAAIVLLGALCAFGWTYATADDPPCPPHQHQVYIPGGTECRSDGTNGSQP